MKKPRFEAYPLDQYPDVTEVEFPDKLGIAYAVCADSCGNAEFIVDGQTQVCQYCGKLMFRTLVEEYQKK